MDVRLTVSAVLLLVIALGATQNQNGTETQTPKNETSDATKECQTARSVSGLCVPRQSCDYGTPAIDFTLFAPHGYTSPCTIEEVCCPIDSMVHSEQNSSPSSIDSDEDEND